MADSYASIGVSTLPMPTLTRSGWAVAPTSPRLGAAVHAFAAGRAEGGGAAPTRPLVGLLHPPDRRGNRS